jgi:hypothetical protein
VVRTADPFDKLRASGRINGSGHRGDKGKVAINGKRGYN